MHYELGWWIDPTLEFVNPTVRIFQRAQTLAQPARE